MFCLKHRSSVTGYNVKKLLTHGFERCLLPGPQFDLCGSLIQRHTQTIKHPASFCFGIFQEFCPCRIITGIKTELGRQDIFLRYRACPDGRTHADAAGVDNHITPGNTGKISGRNEFCHRSKIAVNIMDQRPAGIFKNICNIDLPGIIVGQNRADSPPCAAAADT